MGKSSSKKTVIRKNTRLKERKTEHLPKPFPIVGIGASAGGLEAFSSLLQYLPANLGMAYVFIQHLSPTHESLLPDILKRRTEMMVHKVTNNLEIKKNNIYVIPQNHCITIVDGKLKLVLRDKKDHSFHPVDLFLTSLAPVYQNNAIGILLSGTGTDGTLGLKAIKMEGGITFAQDDTAKYIGMPRSATDAGYVDFVMPPSKIAKELALIVKHPLAGVVTANKVLEESRSEINKILNILHTKCDVDFSHYKQTTIQRRIMRRTLLNRLRSLNEYTRMLRNDDREVQALYHDLLINVTGFFRDSSVYEAFSRKVLPTLFRNRSVNDPVRIWIPGCATGEEAVSFAIVLLEYLGEKAITTPIQIFSTDLNDHAITKARTGLYVKAAVENVSKQRLKKFFIKIDGSYQVVKAIRDICIFAEHDLLKDPPFSRMDVISCQNVLIYLESSPQKKIMHAFHYALKPTGILLLGKSETIGNAVELYNQPDKEYRLYTKKNVSLQSSFEFSVRSIAIPHATHNVSSKSSQSNLEIDIEKEIDKLLLSRYVPACVVVNSDLEILRFRGATAGFLEPASGKASLYLMKMVREDLAYDLRSLLHAAKKGKTQVRKEDIRIQLNGVYRYITMEVVPIKKNAREYFYVILFRETGSNHDSPSGGGKERKSSGIHINRIETLTRQLKDAHEHMKSMNEDFEATREELQSANEEVLSSNEELQSINEELETSKEELQSTNEELTTINDELQNRNIELRESRDFAETIFQSLHESLVVLNSELRIRVANRKFYETFNLQPEDVEGNYFFEIDEGEWNIPELRNLLGDISSKHNIVAIEIEHVFRRLGKRILMLNSHPLYPTDKMPDGTMLLLSMEDITKRKQMEMQLRENEERLRLLIQNASDVITIFSEQGDVIYQSEAIEKMLGYDKDQRVGKNIFDDPIVHPDDLKTKRELFQRLAKKPEELVAAEFRLKRADGVYRTIEAICVNLTHDRRIGGIVASYRDITERKTLQMQKDQFIGIASHELKTPVTSLKALVQILQEELSEQGNKDAVALTEKMGLQINRIIHLISDFLDITRIESGTMQVRNQTFRINTVIDDVIEDFQRSYNREFVKKLSVNKLILGDREKIAQVLGNLISNACKYSPLGKKIIIGSKVFKNEMMICVQDFGPGIPLDMQERIFERFIRLENKNNGHASNGLGLYIASEIVKKLGGRIWVKSSERGSVFYFTIPIKGK